MSEIELIPGSMVGDRPINLSADFESKQDGSIAAQLMASGYYAGIIAAVGAMEERFTDRPELLAELKEVFISDPASEGETNG